LLESISERFVIQKDDKGKPFDHVLEVLDGLIHCQELAVIWTVLFLSGAELMGVESQGLQSTAGTLLQGVPMAYRKCQ
jgi:hypothetical protein